ncbi:MAG: hypothetical protein IPK03_04715 [Bacteroidetes bacterium]|nr:hypothetical protein [Bacteroidota bacterium]
MKKWILIILLIASVDASAVGYAGATIHYEVIDSSADLYKITYSAFYFCGGINASLPSLNINFSSGCPTKNVSGTFVKFNNLPALCLGGNSACNSPTSTNFGIREVVYEAFVTLPKTCGNALIAFQECCLYMNNGPGSFDQNINQAACINVYAETQINLSLAGGNNSTKLLNKKFMNCVTGVKNNFNLIGEDADNDSIVYETITPLCSYKPIYLRQRKSICDGRALFDN